MSQSVAPEDFALSTSQANEAEASFTARAAGIRVGHPAPHLVGASKPHLRPDTIEDGVERSSLAAPSALQHAGNNAESHWIPRLAPAGYPKGFLHEAPKRIVDILGALLIALVFSPLIVTACTVLWIQGGKVIYRHRRFGRGGRTFECLKFRTMRPDADQILRQLLETSPELKREWVQDHKLRDDPRVTSIGRFLRRTSMDELPQLWNVLRGEMSLVGPRPIVREELLRYGRQVREYLAIKPGVTGLWQVMGRNDTDYRRRVAIDTYYVRNQNLVLDLYILCKTTGVVLGGNGAY
jgi:exopolysaccharide production protein ExoY